MFVILLIIMLTGKTIKGHSQDTFTINGNCEISEAGVLYIFLVDEQGSKKPMTGIQELVVNIDSCDTQKIIDFSFKNIPKGEYGIRCFWDMNGNRKLDFKLFTAKEPWGMSWKNKQKSAIPSFNDYSFIVDSDLELKTIYVK